jgi:hypothetical protein
MKQYIILLLALFSAFAVYSQDEKSFLKLGFTGGYGEYTFEKTENINDAVIEQLHFDAAVIDYFPSRFYFGGTALIRFANWYRAGHLISSILPVHGWGQKIIRGVIISTRFFLLTSWGSKKKYAFRKV